jgi:hypothetical protein
MNNVQNLIAKLYLALHIFNIKFKALQITKIYALLILIMF